MKNSKFDDEIQKRMTDPNWDNFISEKVKKKYNSNRVGWFSITNLQRAAAIFLFLGIGWAVIFQFPNMFNTSKSEFTTSEVPPLTNTDIRDLDLLLEKDDINSEYLLTGFIEIYE